MPDIEVRPVLKIKHKNGEEHCQATSCQIYDGLDNVFRGDNQDMFHYGGKLYYLRLLIK